jgi:cysteine-rich repeat protein
MSVVRSFLAAVLLIAGLAPTIAHAAPDTTALKCYRAKDALEVRGPTPDWLKLNEDNCRIGGGFRLVCAPSTEVVTQPIEGRTQAGDWTPITPTILPGPEVLSQDRVCYKIRCVGHTTPSNDTEFTDVFGPRKLKRYRPYLVCGPAEASLCGDGHLDFGEECDDGNRVNGDCCDSTCHAEPATQVCGPDTDGNDCTAPRCGGDGFCHQDGFFVPATTPCGDTDGNVCTTAQCDGAGTCVQDAFFQPATVSCPDTDGNECTSARCDGAGNCNQFGFLQPATVGCTDTDGNDCTLARCNGAGGCNQTGFTQPDGTACTDTDGNVCTHAQCNAGLCDQTVHQPVGTLCPDIDGDACDRAGCDENGLCAQDFFVRNCNNPEVCNPATGVCE